MPKRTWRGHSKRPVILPELTSSSWHSSNRYGGASVPDAKIEKNADSRVFLWREFIVKNRGNDGHNNIAKRQRRRVVVAVWSWNDRVRRNASARTHTHHTHTPHMYNGMSREKLAHLLPYSRNGTAATVWPTAKFTRNYKKWRKFRPSVRATIFEGRRRATREKSP